MLYKICLIGISVLVFYRSFFRKLPPLAEENTVPLSGGPQYTKLVYLVLDGLRFDGFIPVNKTGHYYNKMAVSTDKNINKAYFLSVAGIPTMTSARILSLMSGAPSNALDIIKTAVNKRTHVDTLISRAPSRLAFYGDDYWRQAFGRISDCADVMPSYTKHDMESRENELADRLLDNLRRPSPDDFIFAHFTTLDTCGHALGINHPTMENILIRWNAYITKIYELIDNDTLFVVVSDHGVTDKGEHGGMSEEELASTCCFLSKKPLSIDPNASPDYTRFSSRFYNTDNCNSERDWIKAQAPYNVIHQDDIVVTVSYLLGIPPPAGSYGNLIPHIVRDEVALKNLVNFKLEKYNKTGKHQKPQPAGIELEKYSWQLTELLYEEMVKKCYLGILLALLMGAYVLCSELSKVSISPLLLICFTIVMVTHSVFYFASESYIWLSILLLKTKSLEILLIFLYYIKSPCHKHLSMDRIVLDTKWLFIDLSQFSSTQTPVFIAMLVMCARCINFKPLGAWLVGLRKNAGKANNRTTLKSNRARVGSDFRKYAIPLAYSIYSLVTGRRDRELKMAILGLGLSLESLVAVHLSPHCAIMVMLFLSTPITTYDAPTLFTMLASIPYLCGTEQMVQSIDPGIFFTFTDSFGAVSSVLSGISYFVVPRFLILQKFVNQRPFSRDEFLFLNSLALYTAFCCATVQSGYLAFEKLLIHRLFFVTSFNLVDRVIIYGLTQN